MFVYAIPVVAALVAGFLSFALWKNDAKLLFALLVIVLAGFTGWLIFEMEHATGYDALGYFLGLVGLNAPMAAGMGIGAFWGHRSKKRQMGHETS